MDWQSATLRKKKELLKPDSPDAMALRTFCKRTYDRFLIGRFERFFRYAWVSLAVYPSRDRFERFAKGDEDDCESEHDCGGCREK